MPNTGTIVLHFYTKPQIFALYNPSLVKLPPISLASRQVFFVFFSFPLAQKCSPVMETKCREMGPKICSPSSWSGSEMHNCDVTRQPKEAYPETSSSVHIHFAQMNPNHQSFVYSCAKESPRGKIHTRILKEKRKRKKRERKKSKKQRNQHRGIVAHQTMLMYCVSSFAKYPLGNV